MWDYILAIQIDYWKKLQTKSKRTKGTSLIYEDLETASSVIRDLFTPDINKIVIDSKKLYRKLQSYLEDISPNMANRLEYYKLKQPLFESMGFENCLLYTSDAADE